MRESTANICQYRSSAASLMPSRESCSEKMPRRLPSIGVLPPAVELPRNEFSSFLNSTRVTFSASGRDSMKSRQATTDLPSYVPITVCCVGRPARALDSRILFECRAPKGSFDWVEPGNVISERVFFKVDGDWYVDDVREADGAKAKRRERRRRDFYRNFSPRSFHPTKAFLDKWVRGMYGWKNVKPSDVVITRETCAEGIYYRVRKTVGKGDWFSVTSFGKR